MKLKGKKIRFFANRDRVTRTRIVYVALTVGTVAVAFLFVLLNRLIFKLSESSLYGNAEYEVVSIISANSIGAPLSLETRLDLFRECEREGAERAVMPGELSQSAILERIGELWNDTLDLHSNGEKLFSGESLRTVRKNSRYTATLRDFYNEQTGAKLALWCAQAYYEASNGQVYCLSVQYDSRTGDAYSINCAMFQNVRTDLARRAIIPFLTANGYADSLAERMNPIATETGISGTLTLPDGLQLSLDYTFGEQYEITFR
jgi:hypothetical protein